MKGRNGLIGMSVLLGMAGTAVGQVAHWRLDEGSGTVVNDSTLNGNHGTLEQVQAWSSDVPATGFANNWALEFDGVDDYVETGWDGILGGAERTVSFWVKSTASNDHGIVAWGNSTANGEKWHLRVNNNGGNGPVGAIRTEVQGDFNVGTTVINDGQWHHVVSVFPAAGTTADDVLHYVDGVLEVAGGTGSGSPAINTTVTNPMTIGRRTQGTVQRHFGGLVDDVRVYDRALDLGEVIGLSGVSPTTGGLVSHYDFEDGPGSTVVTDQGTNGLNGTLNGVATTAGVSWSADSPLASLDGSLSFRGDNGWVDTSYEGIGDTAARTMAMWVKIDPSTALVDNGFFGYGDTATGEKWHLRVNQAAGDGLVGGFRLEVEGGRMIGTVDIADGQWHHVAVAFEDDGTPMLGDTAMYVDGVLELNPSLGDTAINTDILGAGAKPVSLGRRLQGDIPKYFTGNLSDVRIYDRVLSGAEIAALTVPEPSGALLVLLAAGLVVIGRRR